MTDTTALVKAQEYRLALEPRSFTEVRDIAKMATRIGMCGVKSEEEGVLRILFGRELAFTAMQALRLVSVINGRPSVDATAIVGRCLQHPECEYFELVESSATKATWKTKRRGRPEQVLSWTIEQAKQAKLDGKDNWRNWPENMLRARAATNLARVVWPEVTAGLFTADELSHGVVEVRDGQVVHVEPPVDPPVLVRADVTVVDATPEDVSMTLLQDIDHAESLSELGEIAARIKGIKDLKAPVRKGLVDAYRRKKEYIDQRDADASQPQGPADYPDASA